MKKEYARKGFLWFITSGRTSNFSDVAMCPAVCRFLMGVLAVALLVYLSCQPAFAAISESDVQAQVGSAGKGAVTGNVPIWFLYTVGFLRIPQKIDSLITSLGVNVGHTGGSMLAETMVATEGLSTIRNASSRHFGNGRSNSTRANSVRGSKSGAAGAMNGFMSGELASVVSRSIQNGATKAAAGSSETGTSSRVDGVEKDSDGVDGQIFASSVSKGGNFANNVISSTATGSIAASGSMTGEETTQTLRSYMGYAALGESTEHIPSFSDMEIGGNRTTGTGVSEEYPEGAAFSMYRTTQYTAPSGDYTTIQTVDGAS